MHWLITKIHILDILNCVHCTYQLTWQDPVAWGTPTVVPVTKSAWALYLWRPSMLYKQIKKEHVFQQRRYLSTVPWLRGEEMSPGADLGMCRQALCYQPNTGLACCLMNLHSGPSGPNWCKTKSCDEASIKSLALSNMITGGIPLRAMKSVSASKIASKDKEVTNSKWTACITAKVNKRI